jgi:hypothetical protein
MITYPFQMSIIAGACVALAFCVGIGEGIDGNVGSPAKEIGRIGADVSAPSATVLSDFVISGTVTGLSSIVVNGSQIEDRNTPARTGSQAGPTAGHEASLGHQLAADEASSPRSTPVHVESPVERRTAFRAST